MVYIYSVAIIDNNEDPLQLHISYELSKFSFWQRSTVKDLCILVSNKTATKCKNGEYICLEHNDVVCYAYALNGIAVTAVTDTEYPPRVIAQLMNKVMQMYVHHSIVNYDGILNKYQNIKSVDKISIIQSELDDTIKICHESINKLCLRQDELEEILEKSDSLLVESLRFSGEAEKLNSCCTIL